MVTTKRKHLSAAIAFAAILASAPEGSCADLVFDIPLASLTSHNTSASPTYNQRQFPANFGTASWVSPTETTSVDPTRMDRGMNPVTPGHVSRMDVHTLIPSRPDLRWFAHVMLWWGTGSPFNVGYNMDTDAYVKAMVTDLINRGFNGVIVCWGGASGRYVSITQRIQKYLKTLPAGSFTFIILIDEGLVSRQPAPQQKLQDAVEYCKTNYFSDLNYEREGGNPVLMFYGVRQALGRALGQAEAAAAMMAVKSAAGGNMVWVGSDKTDITEAWADQNQNWQNAWPDGLHPTDPYNLFWVNEYYDKWVKPYPQKQGFGGICAGFNGSLSTTGGSRSSSPRTRNYLPRGSGACLVQRAASINAHIPSNVTRMQWETWNDYSEGTAVEAGIENDVTLNAEVEGTTLSWKVTSGTGDESTIDHYEIYASADGVNAADLGPVPVGTHLFDLQTVRGLASEVQVVIIAVGKPCVRDHASNRLTYTYPGNRQHT